MKTAENVKFLQNVLKIDHSFLSAANHDYVQTMSKTPTGFREWLKWYLHLFADTVAPNRHKIFATPQTLSMVSESDLPDIGVLPIEMPLYYLLLKENNLVTEFDSLNQELMAYKIEQSLYSVFSEKIVYLLPGRGGQIAQFLLDLGVKKLVTCTDDRYWQHFQNCTYDETGKRLMVFQTRLFQFFERIAHHDIEAPDIIICTNMFNASRHNGKIKKHQMEVEWQTLLSQILSLARPSSTRIFISPALDHLPVFTKDELLDFIGERGTVTFYEPEPKNESLCFTKPSDFAFCIKIKDTSTAT